MRIAVGEGLPALWFLGRDAAPSSEHEIEVDAAGITLATQKNGPG